MLPAIDPEQLSELHGKYAPLEPDQPQVSSFHSFSNYLLTLSFQYDLITRWSNIAATLKEQRDGVMEELHGAYRLDPLMDDPKKLPLHLTPRPEGTTQRDQLRKFGRAWTREMFEWYDLNENQSLELTVTFLDRNSPKPLPLILGAPSHEGKYTASFSTLGMHTETLYPMGKPKPGNQTPITPFRQLDLSVLPSHDHALFETWRATLFSLLDTFKGAVDPAEINDDIRHMRFAYRAIDRVEPAFQPMRDHLAERLTLFPTPPPELVIDHARSDRLDLKDRPTRTNGPARKRNRDK